MPNPIRNWTEDDVLALPAGENDSFERKGSRLLDLKLSGVKEDDVLNEFAKQLSAFSNTGGGQIIYGVANNGTVDGGGVALSVKGRQSTKEWLEDVIPKLTEFEIIGIAKDVRFGLWIDANNMREQDLALARDLRKLGANVMLIGQRLPIDAADLVFNLPEIPTPWQFLIDIIPAQLVAERLARRSGSDPDTFNLCKFVVEDESGLL